MRQTGLRVGTRRSRAGFTLVELMVTIFVAAILLAIAVPSFKHITASSRLTTVANNMVSVLNTARMEAIKRNAKTLFCGNVGTASGKLVTACNNDDVGAVYTLTTNAAGTSTVVKVQAAPVITTTSMHMETVNAIMYGPQGLGQRAGNVQPAYSGTVAKICSTSIGSKNIRVIKMTTGSILETTTSSGACQ